MLCANWVGLEHLDLELLLAESFRLDQGAAFTDLISTVRP